MIKIVPPSEVLEPSRPKPLHQAPHDSDSDPTTMFLVLLGPVLPQKLHHFHSKLYFILIIRVISSALFCFVGFVSLY